MRSSISNQLDGSTNIPGNAILNDDRSRAYRTTRQRFRKLTTTMSVDAIDVAEEIRKALPGTEEIVVQYLSGYLVDDAGEDEDTLQITRDILESAVADGKEAVIDELLVRLSDMLEKQIKARIHSRVPTLRKLGNVMDMSKAGAMSNTIALSEGVDLESVNKSKCVLRS